MVENSSRLDASEMKHPILTVGRFLGLFPGYNKSSKYITYGRLILNVVVIIISNVFISFWVMKHKDYWRVNSVFMCFKTLNYNCYVLLVLGVIIQTLLLKPAKFTELENKLSTALRIVKHQLEQGRKRVQEALETLLFYGILVFLVYLDAGKSLFEMELCGFEYIYILFISILGTLFVILAKVKLSLKKLHDLMIRYPQANTTKATLLEDVLMWSKLQLTIAQVIALYNDIFGFVMLFMCVLAFSQFLFIVQYLAILRVFFSVVNLLRNLAVYNYCLLLILKYVHDCQAIDDLWVHTKFLTIQISNAAGNEPQRELLLDFIRQTDDTFPHFSACGCFHINYSFLFTLLQICLTYIVVMYQFDKLHLV